MIDQDFDNPLVSTLDVKYKDSETSLHLKPGISKEGIEYIRKAMYFPALAAIRYDGKMKGLFIRLIGKHGIKMKAMVAIQRKITGADLCIMEEKGSV